MQARSCVLPPKITNFVKLKFAIFHSAFIPVRFIPIAFYSIVEKVCIPSENAKLGRCPGLKSCPGPGSRNWLALAALSPQSSLSKCPLGGALGGKAVFDKCRWCLQATSSNNCVFFIILCRCFLRVSKTVAGDTGIHHGWLLVVGGLRPGHI